MKWLKSINFILVLAAMVAPIVDFPEAFGPSMNMTYGKTAALDIAYTSGIVPVASMCLTLPNFL
jgi:hypothetical protein